MTGSASRAAESSSTVSRTDAHGGLGAQVTSGAEASVTWSRLEQQTEYGWYVRATDKFGAAAESAAYSFTTAAPDCTGSDTRPTVVAGEQDSGVANYPVEECTTINDPIDEEADWSCHGEFVGHVRTMPRGLLDDGVITQAERRAIDRAAARSDVGS